MGRVNFNPAKTGFSRVFIIEGRARADHKPVYQGTLKAGGFSRTFGDVTPIEVPSQDEFGKFEEVGQIRGATERVSITLTGRYAADVKSEMLRMATSGCAVDLHINIGSCTDPRDYNVYSKKIVLEDGFLTNYETDDIGALSSDELDKVDESTEASARRVYELTQVTFASRGGDVITNELLDVVVCGTPSCGDCDDEDSGCNKYFAISKAAGGSPSTPADVVFSIDAGVTWNAHDIDTLGSADDPSGIECVGSNLVVVSEASESLHYASKSDFDGIADPEFTEVSNGFVTGAGPRAIAADGGTAFIVGANGYIYKTENPSDGVDVLDAGALTTSDFNDIGLYSKDFAVAVGNDGVIVKTDDGLTFKAVSSPVGVGVNINAVAVKSKTEWFIATSNGKLYYTTNGGDNWAEKEFSGSGTGVLEDVVVAGETVMFISHTVSGKGRILRSTNGGYDWIVLPQGTGSLPANDKINAIAACQYDPDSVVGVGLADDGSDGVIITGTAR